MYFPAISYETYKVEHGIALSSAQRQAADEHAARVVATLGRQWRAVVGVLTSAGRRKAGRQWNVVTGNANRPLPCGPLHSGGARVVAISTRRVSN